MAKSHKRAAVVAAEAPTVAPIVAPVEHLNPSDRAHLWQRPARADEAAPVTPSDAPYELPRYLHKQGDAAKLVTTVEQCEAARADGWVFHPDWIDEPAAE